MTTQSQILRQQAEAERLKAHTAGLATVRQAAIVEADRYDRLAEERERVEQELQAGDPDAQPPSPT